MKRETGCDGVMVARGAQGNPWIFAEILAALEGRAYFAPSVEERFAVAMEHARGLVFEKGERVGVAEARKHLSWYLHGVRVSPPDLTAEAVSLADTQISFSTCFKVSDSLSFMNLYVSSKLSIRL
jgi:tRNA-dihydrouridine synthase